VIKLTKNLCIILLLLPLAACTSTEIREYDPKITGGPKKRVFHENFDDIWQATQIALSHYPISVNDIEAGILETDFIRGENSWKSPHLMRRTPGGQRYKISVRILKGKSKTPGKKAVQVTILKRTELQKDFFSPYESINSDGLEEIALLYRIERELRINTALDKIRL